MATGRGRRLRVAAPFVAVIVAGVAVQSRPEPVRAVVGQQTPPTTQPDLLKDLLNNLFPTTTVPAPAPPPAPGQDPAAAGSAPAPLEGAPDSPTKPVPGQPTKPVPPPIDFRPRAGMRSNAPLLEAVRQLESVGFTPPEAMAVGLGRFPILGPAYYTDGFLEPRPGHYHQGVDITANMGTPVRAPGDGVLYYSEEGGYGKVASVVVDGTTYFMAHLDGYAADLSSGSSVKQGQVVGTVGMTGNATGPHVHFEVRRGGTIDPKPVLDQWLDEAMAAIPVIVASYKGLEASLPRALSSTGQLRRFDERPAGAAAALDALAWASSVSPGGQVVPLAERRVQEIANVVASDSAVPPPATPESWQRAEGLAQALLSPLTPAPLQEVFVAGGD